MGHLLRYIFEPGFFASGPVHVALAVGAVVAITSAVVGVFTVTRGQSFAGHSLADIATTGGSGAFLIGVNQFWGFLAFGAGAAAFMEMIGVQRRRGRDVATGVVLGAALGLAALFLYLGTQASSTTGASFTILFGSIFVITTSTVPALIASALLALATVVVLARVLLLSSLSTDIAAARGVPVRAVGAAYLMALAVSVALSAVIIGAVLSTALLIGPAATALRLARSPVRAVITAAVLGVLAVWLGVRAGLRQLLLAARRARLAGQLLRGHAHRRRLPAHRPAPPRPPGRPGRRPRPGARMFTGLMLNTWIAGTVVAVIAGVTGFFAVLRGSTFAAHAIPNGAFAGAAGATLLGFNPLAGLAVFSVAGALGIAGLSRRASNDVATALTLVMMLGVGALFVSWSTEYAQEAYSLLFGEVFGVSSDEVLPILVLGAVSIAAIIVMFRPLLLSSALPEVAEARGVSARRMELAFLLVMALATSMTVPVVGALLMFSLMIGPSAAARSVTARPVLAMTLAVVIALVTVWTGIVVSYVSPTGRSASSSASWAPRFFLPAAATRGPRQGRPGLRRGLRSVGAVNRLKDSTSPYLLQHADNPVDWWPWCEAAFERSRPARPARHAVRRLRRLPLVPRDGARVVRGPGHGGAAQRAHGRDQGGPGGAARRRFGLHDRDPGHDRPGRLADDRVHDPGPGAVLLRYLLPPGPLPAADPRRRAGLA